MNATINLSWTQFKQDINKGSSWKYYENDSDYRLIVFDPPFVGLCYLEKNESKSLDQIDFETNFKDQGLCNKQLTSNVTTQYEVNDKDLKLARSHQAVGEDGTATISLKVPGTFGQGNGRYIAGGYGISEDYNKDDYVLAWLSDDDRAIAWMMALQQDPNAAQPIDDSVIQQMGEIPGIKLILPNYPTIKTFHDTETPSENQGWFFWANAIGNNTQATGEVEIEPIAGYGYLPSGFYLKVKYIRPEEITYGGLRVNFFWGEKS